MHPLSPPRVLRLGLALACLAGPASRLAAQVPARATAILHEELNEWFRRTARVAPGEWGVAVADERGQLLWSVNATTPLIPASTVKLFTTGFARTRLGPEARQVTRVVGTGAVDPVTGIWIGTWAMEVNGDPTLERPARSGPMLRDLAAQLAGRGIRELRGPFSVRSPNGPAAAQYPTAWASRHRGRAFAPLVGPLTVNENLVSFTIAPGPRPGTPPSVASSSPDGMAALVTITARTVEGSRSRLRIDAAPGGRYLVQGTIGVRARPRGHTGPTANPHAVLEAAWNAALAGAGIAWVQDSAPGNEVVASLPWELTLAEVVSAPLDSIAAEVNARSLNIGAEALLRWAADPSEDPAIQLTRHVHQVTGETMGVHLADGSGLSAADRATAYSFVKYLARFPATPAGRNFPLLLPANGDGTLRRLGSGTMGPGVVRAKTGTLGNVSSLVGYLGHRDGMLLISVLYNGPRVSAARQRQWALFQVLGAEGSAVPGETATFTEQSVAGEAPGRP